jgi:GTPase Era involved in 16S rRNA processing
MAKKKLPIRSKSHRNEDISKRKFEEVMDPWFVHWQVRDYGVDCTVEVAVSTLNEAHYATNMRFAVQLKSIEKINATSHLGYAVPVEKIFYWYNSNIPVMFAVYSLDKKQFFYLWIDESVLVELDRNSSSWAAQQTITLHIPIQNAISDLELEKILGYINKWKRPVKQLIKAGIYFNLKDDTDEILKSYNAIVDPFKFDSIEQEIKTLQNQIDSAIYRVAITGPSRAGKSTLINSLLRREISPSDIFQTTGVPIQIIPGSKEYVQTLFKDGKIVQEKVNMKNISKYASQTENEDNIKGVQIITVSLVNRLLDRGISFFDIPGLDDPDENVQAYTMQTVIKSNIIIYLIDASPFRNGGYILRNDFRKNLIDFGTKLDKVFLVFNKVDDVPKSKRKLLKERVEKDLKRYNLKDKVHNEVFFISAEEAFKNRIEKKSKEDDNLKQLEDAIWGFLLQESNIGFVRLRYALQEIQKSEMSFTDVLKSRLLDQKERERLDRTIHSIHSDTSELNSLFHTGRLEACRNLKTLLNGKRSLMLHILNDSLKEVPQNKSLPSNNSIKSFLIGQANNSIVETNEDYDRELQRIKVDADLWFMSKLKLVRDIIAEGDAQRTVDFSSLNNFEVPRIDPAVPAFGFGVSAFFLGAVISWPVAAFAGIVGFFARLFTSEEEVRLKNIERIMKLAKEKSKELYDSIFEKYEEVIDESIIEISKQYQNKIHLYLKDLTLQTSKLSKPLSSLEKQKYDKAVVLIADLDSKINELDNEIKNLL